MGGCGWTRCPRHWFLSHVAQDTARSWFRGAGAHCAVFSGFLAPFWAVSRTYCGIGGHQRAPGHWKVKPHLRCSSCLGSFGCFEPLLGLFLAKNGCFWPKNSADLGGHLPTGRHCSGPPTLTFWLKTWICQGHHVGSTMATWANDPKRWDGAMAKTARRSACCCCCCSCCCCCCCCLLAKFKGRGV